MKPWLFPPGARHIFRQMEGGFRWYEEPMLRDMKRRLEESPAEGIGVDVGAYCGTHAMWMAWVCGLRVVAFEPVPEQYEYLQANVDRNQADVQCVRMAAGRIPSFGRLNRVDVGNTGCDQIVLDPQGEILVVPLDLFGFTKVRVLKIDVEGSERAVLEGAYETITRSHPLIYVEGDRGSLQDWLKPLGYSCFGEFNATPTFGFRYGL